MTGEEILKDCEIHMKATIEATRHECSKIRTGRASTGILDGIDVECYGGKNSLPHVANLTVPDTHTILIQPYDRSIIKAIETALLKSDLGLTPNNDGSVIRLNLPALTEERRRDLVKVVKKIGEEGKIALRNLRHKANDKVKKGEKEGIIPKDESKALLDKIQNLTDRYTENIDKVLKEKEDEIMKF